MDRSKETCNILGGEEVLRNFFKKWNIDIEEDKKQNSYSPWKGTRSKGEAGISHEVRDQAAAGVGEQIPGLLGAGVCEIEQYLIVIYKVKHQKSKNFLVVTNSL